SPGFWDLSAHATYGDRVRTPQQGGRNAQVTTTFSHRPDSSDGGRAVAALAPQARGQALSSGCAALNDPQLDGSYEANQLTNLQFAAGDHITMTAGEPAAGDLTKVWLYIEFHYDPLADLTTRKPGCRLAPGL